MALAAGVSIYSIARYTNIPMETWYTVLFFYCIVPGVFIAATLLIEILHITKEENCKELKLKIKELESK